MDHFNSIAESVAALAEARRAVKGNAGLSRALGGEITSQAISQWKRVPASRARAVERVTGIPCHRLRPDLYQAPEPEQVA